MTTCVGFIVNRVWELHRKALEASLASFLQDERTVESRVMSILLAEGSDAERIAAFGSLLGPVTVLEMPGTASRAPCHYCVHSCGTWMADAGIGPELCCRLAGSLPSWTGTCLDTLVLAGAPCLLKMDAPISMIFWVQTMILGTLAVVRSCNSCLIYHRCESWMFPVDLHVCNCRRTLITGVY
jgi:hypothetical protein